MSKIFAQFKSPVIALPVIYDECTPAYRRLVREEYVKRQKGLCQFCLEPLSKGPVDKVRTRWIDPSKFPSGFLDHPIHLHHCRETGKTIGAVHARCNAYLWQYEGE